ncbi:uncharacterized protein LODBEIA_P32480 [Lodderomyces beijingensis]|uniref:Altered inheritance of mitochondria protein 18, mitochondrial n=1 Tax=Lodderomyces beijingensis TaxID=1775926 RepID=A0ABP0ZLK3_9ASCO
MFRAIRARPLRSILPVVAISSGLAYTTYKFTSTTSTTTTTPRTTPWILSSILPQIHLDTPQPPRQTEVKVDDSISAFPTHIPKSQLITQNFTLLGHGVRSVTFIGFKVYGVAIYIAEADIPKAHRILANFASWNPAPQTPHTSSSPVQSSLVHALTNPAESEAIVESLLDSGVHFLIRLSPVRNTDFSHLKDGFIKSILAHSSSKNASGDEKSALNQGLDQLREIFGKNRGSVPKDDLLVLEQLHDGSLAIAYVGQQKKKKNQENGENVSGARKVREMGTVSGPVVAKTLLLSYLSGSKPLSESLRKSCMEGLAEIAETQ